MKFEMPPAPVRSKLSKLSKIWEWDDNRSPASSLTLAGFEDECRLICKSALWRRTHSPGLLLSKVVARVTVQDTPLELVVGGHLLQRKWNRAVRKRERERSMTLCNLWQSVTWPYYETTWFSHLRVHRLLKYWDEQCRKSGCWLFLSIHCGSIKSWVVGWLRYKYVALPAMQTTVWHFVKCSLCTSAL